MFPLLRKLVSVLILSASVALCAQDQSTSIPSRVDQILRSFNHGFYIGEVSVSPDGKRLAWIQGAPGGTEIRIAPLDNLAKSVRATAATTGDQHCREGDLTWSPDSAALAFLSD
jgi:Tol biopolymer transport system component